MDALLGRYLTPTVILTDSSRGARRRRRRCAPPARRPLDQMVSEVRTLDDVVPRDAAEKIAEVAASARS